MLTLLSELDCALIHEASKQSCRELESKQILTFKFLYPLKLHLKRKCHQQEMWVSEMSTEYISNQFKFHRRRIDQISFSRDINEFDDANNFYFLYVIHRAESFMER